MLLGETCSQLMLLSVPDCQRKHLRWLLGEIYQNMRNPPSTEIAPPILGISLQRPFANAVMEGGGQVFQMYTVIMDGKLRNTSMIAIFRKPPAPSKLMDVVIAAAKRRAKSVVEGVDMTMDCRVPVTVSAKETCLL